MGSDTYRLYRAYHAQIDRSVLCGAIWLYASLAAFAAAAIGGRIGLGFLLGFPGVAAAYYCGNVRLRGINSRFRRRGLPSVLLDGAPHLD